MMSLEFFIDIILLAAL